ncbi:hypothetical protein MLD38_028521 [Melastoma candidum]|uniref:Uncharacterized protein n=1 Tax=Melastoma candidum TaxID=119954 RepID=A0ACB9N119_9MYRT|nr:hypothetical protein MLD38_028521 [Melastoma candidum]
MKDLQDHVRLLEEDIAMKSMVFGKRYRARRKDNDRNSEMPSSGQIEGELPEVEARVLGKHILLRIHCEKHQGRIGNIFKELEKLSLTVISHSILLFGNSILNVTVVAKVITLLQFPSANIHLDQNIDTNHISLQMDAAFRHTMKDLARNLCHGHVH